MSLHFLNLGLRFCLEMISLIAVGIWGWRHGEGWERYALAIGIPLVLSVIWGVFNVPGDPSRGGHAPVVVPGIIRLVIEICFFSIGVWVLINIGYVNGGWAFCVVVIIHYFVSYHRVVWLIGK